MPENVRLVSPDEIEQNPENPRMIFRESELKELEASIASQGILVPLTVFASGKRLVILDGERRWRCSRRLSLARIPVIVQPEPTRMQNVMMMFAIHNQRREWDPLPTALKLQQLEDMYSQVEGKSPNEAELAQLASMSRGEVRRLKNMLALPSHYLDELMQEGEKPRAQQTLTVDHVLEATRGAQALRKRGIVDEETEERLTSAIVEKYRSGVIRNTVEPRQLARIARAVGRDELSQRTAIRVTQRIISDPKYSIEHAFQDSVARVDREHTIEQQVRRLSLKLGEELDSRAGLGDKLSEALGELFDVVSTLLRRRS